jgi:poly(3-hydroxybutyrate) depolymerase
LISAVAVVVSGGACESGDVDLGTGGVYWRGHGGSPASGAGGALAASGTGGRASGAAAGSAAAGSFSQVAGAAGSGGATPFGGAGGAAGSTPALASSSGCGLPPPATDTSIQVNGMTGSYIVDLPKGYDRTRAYPLLMAFRGAGVTADAFRTYLNLAPAVGADAIVVNANCLSDAATWDVQRDVPLFDGLLTKLESNYCVDPARVFAVGHGAGGFFVNALGCMRGDKLRGVAPLSAGPPIGTCPTEFAVWISQGNQDMALAMGRADRDFWAKQNRCDATMSTAVDPSPCVEYAGCDAGFAVRYCEYDGDLGLPSFAAAGIWSFFKGL